MSDGPRLAIDTSTVMGAVAVGTAGATLAELAVRVSARHAESLLPAIEFGLCRAGLAPRQLGAIVVGAGPGSFTGVRIAAATAKGMAHALGIELYAYSSLLAIAASAAQLDRPVCAVVDALRGEVYAACYRFGADDCETLMEPGVRTAEQVSAELAGVEPLFVGDGASVHRERLGRSGVVAGERLSWPRASALLWLTDRWPDAGRVARPDGWEPAYLRPWSTRRGAQG